MEQKFFLGIDVSKGYADFTILSENKEVVEENFQLDDNFEGHNKLTEVLSKFIERHPGSKIFAAAESTGGYENNWISCLSKNQSILNLSVARLNPYGVNYNSKATLNRIVTDKQSARNVAEYMISHPEKIKFDNQDYFSAIRRQWGLIKLLTKQKVQLLNQLNSLLYTANPEILKYCRNGMRLWTLELLKRYPTARDLSRQKASSLSKIRYIKDELAQRIIEEAKQSVASSMDDNTAKLIKTLVEEIIHLIGVIKNQNLKLEKMCDIKEIKVLKSFKGIGTNSAIGLMLEIISVERFSTVKKLSSFFGLHPVFKQSGDGLSGFKMSKRGRKEPRQILFNVSRYAIVHNPYIKEIYTMHLKKGMCKMSAIGAIMHKIIRIVYGMLKHNQPYNPEIDKTNREKHNKSVKSNKPDVSRRYQTINLNAPISRRQNKKRKEIEKSHIINPPRVDCIDNVFAGSNSISFPD